MKNTLRQRASWNKWAINPYASLSAILLILHLFGEPAFLNAQQTINQNGLSMEMLSNYKAHIDGMSTAQEDYFVNQLHDLNAPAPITYAFVDNFTQEVSVYMRNTFDYSNNDIQILIVRRPNSDGITIKVTRGSQDFPELQKIISAEVKKLKVTFPHPNGAQISNYLMSALQDKYWMRQIHTSTNSENQVVTQPDPTRAIGTPESPSTPRNRWMILSIFGAAGLSFILFLIYKRYPERFKRAWASIARTFWDSSEEKAERLALADQVKSLINELWFVRGNAREYAYILPDNIDAILAEFEEREKLFENQERLDPRKHEAEPLAQQKEGLGGITKLYRIIGIIQKLKERQYDFALGDHCEMKLNQLSGRLEALQWSNTDWIGWVLEFEWIEELQKLSTQVLVGISEFLATMDPTCSATITADHTPVPWDAYTAVLEEATAPTTTSNWQWKVDNHQIHNLSQATDTQEYVDKTHIHLTQFRESINLTIKQLDTYIKNIGIVERKITEYEKEFTTTSKNQDTFTESLWVYEKQFPQLITINTAIVTKKAQALALFEKWMGLHNTTQRDWPSITSTLESGQKGLREVIELYEAFEQAQKNFESHRKQSSQITSEIAVYTGNAVFNHLPYYITNRVAIWTLESQIPSAIDPSEVNRHELSDISWRLLWLQQELLKQFEAYKAAKRDYEVYARTIEQNNQTIRQLEEDLDIRSWDSQIVIYITQVGNRFELEEATRSITQSQDIIIEQYRSDLRQRREAANRNSWSTNILIIGNSGWNQSWGVFNNDHDGDSNWWRTAPSNEEPSGGNTNVIDSDGVSDWTTV